MIILNYFLHYWLLIITTVTTVVDYRCCSFWSMHCGAPFQQVAVEVKQQLGEYQCNHQLLIFHSACSYQQYHVVSHYNLLLDQLSTLSLLTTYSLIRSLLFVSAFGAFGCAGGWQQPNGRTGRLRVGNTWTYSCCLLRLCEQLLLVTIVYIVVACYNCVHCRTVVACYDCVHCRTVVDSCTIVCIVWIGTLRLFSWFWMNGFVLKILECTVVKVTLVMSIEKWRFFLFDFFITWLIAHTSTSEESDDWKARQHCHSAASANQKARIGSILCTRRGNDCCLFDGYCCEHCGLFGGRLSIHQRELDRTNWF